MKVYLTSKPCISRKLTCCTGFWVHCPVGNGVVVSRGVQEFCVGLFLNGPAAHIQVQNGTPCMWQTLAQWKHGTFQWDISRMLMTWKQYQMYQKFKKSLLLVWYGLHELPSRCSQPEEYVSLMCTCLLWSPAMLKFHNWQKY